MDEIELFEQLVKMYNTCSTKSSEAAQPALMGVKGALQYRRILGEEIFNAMMKKIKNQFYSSVDEKEEI